MTEDKIVMVAKIEDDAFDKKPFKKVTATDGEVYKIKQGRGGKLMEKWPLLEEGLAVRLFFGEYTNPSGVKFPFVEDFEMVKDALPPPKPMQGTAPKPVVAVTDRDTQIWKAVCLKELGECIRSGEIDKSTPTGKKLRLAYYAILFAGLDLKIEDKVD